MAHINKGINYKDYLEIIKLAKAFEVYEEFCKTKFWEYSFSPQSIEDTMKLDIRLAAKILLDEIDF